MASMGEIYAECKSCGGKVPMSKYKVVIMAEFEPQSNGLEIKANYSEKIVLCEDCYNSRLGDVTGKTP